MDAYQVIVGNIGSVFIGENENKARQSFNECVKLSKNKYGRWAVEPVTLFKGDTIIKEYTPKGDENG